ncbi:MAG TPA: FAD-binding oxidoreductase [Gammaproteobacteria bacterium]|nr:FAD-binding oxidoreductase [Gammaproteobacteria bacterium]
MRTKTSEISGWGRYPVQSCNLMRPEKYADLHAYTDSCIARGQGRSYGDASLNHDHAVILTEKLNRFIRFDQKTGIITAEAGLALIDLLTVIVPAGWFVPVTPGTQFVSLGGCVAADVHGKNHHRVGSFGQHALNLKLILADGSHITCSPSENTEIFFATVGGMGLTGIIGEVTLQLIPIKSQFMAVQHHAVTDLAEMGIYDDDYSVTWLDTERERGIVMTAHHADGSLKLNADKNKTGLRPPSFLLNHYSIRLFNYLYFQKNSRKSNFSSDYKPYFYPLDKITDWNKMYGKQGFVQYQCVFPKQAALIGIHEILKIMKKNNTVSFLSVLKRLGKSSGGLLSFPMEGLTLAMDIAFNSSTLKLLKEFDQIVLAHQGRVYLAKDACLSPESFRAMYPQYEKFAEIKHKIDPQNIFSSSLSKRLQIGN